MRHLCGGAQTDRVHPAPTTEVCSLRRTASSDVPQLPTVHSRQGRHQHQRARRCPLQRRTPDCTHPGEAEDLTAYICAIRQTVSTGRRQTGNGGAQGRVVGLSGDSVQRSRPIPEVAGELQAPAVASVQQAVEEIDDGKAQRAALDALTPACTMFVSAALPPCRRRSSRSSSAPSPWRSRSRRTRSATRSRTFTPLPPHHQTPRAPRQPPPPTTAIIDLPRTDAP